MSFKNFIFRYRLNRNSRDYYYWWFKEVRGRIDNLFCLASRFNFHTSKDIAIDIIIPVVEKDLDVLSYVVANARKNVLHRIDMIYLVAPDSDKIKSFCDWSGCIFVDEKSVTEIKKGDINYVCKGLDRSGWLLQQLIKLNADRISDKKYILILDADTVFIRPRRFISGGKVKIDFSDEYYMAYYKTYEELLGLKHSFPVSFVSHYMLFEGEKLKALRDCIEKVSKKSWERAIVEKIDIDEQSFFSEYETYANFVLTNYGRHYRINYWFNKSLNKEELKDFSELEKKYSKEYLSLSFHAYNT